MNDIELWELLGSPTLDVGRVVPLLEALSEKPVLQRAPFWGRLRDCLHHENPRLRGAAVRTLAGACGYPAFQELVRLLDDPEGEVRDSAVEAVRGSADGPGRWAHVLFHPNGSVRRAGVLEGTATAPGAMTLCLLSDGATSDLVRGRLKELVRDAPSVGMLLAFVDSGDLESEVVVDIFMERWSAPNPKVWLDHLSHSNIPPAQHSLANLRRYVENAHFNDSLDAIIRFLWRHHPAFFDVLGDAVAAGRFKALDELRIAWSILRVGFATKAWTPKSLAIAGSAMPIILTNTDIHTSVRKNAALLVRSVRGALRIPNPLKLLEGTVLVASGRHGGVLNLDVIGSLMSLTSDNPFHVLCETYSQPKILANAQRAPHTALALLDEPPTDDKYRELYRDLVLLVCEAAKTRGPELLAELATRLQREWFQIIAKQDISSLAMMADVLLRKDSLGELKLSDAKRLRLVSELGSALASRGLPDLIGSILRLDEPKECRLAVSLLCEAAHVLSPANFVVAVAGLSTDDVRQLIRLLDDMSLFPWSTLHAIARSLVSHPEDDLRRWGDAVVNPPKVAPSPSRSWFGSGGKKLKRTERAAIIDGEPFVHASLRPCWERPIVGLCEALLARKWKADADIEVCGALLVSHDPPEEVAALFEEFSADKPEFLSKLDRLMVSRCTNATDLPWLANVWLHLWERRLADFTQDGLKRYRTLLGILEGAAKWPSPTLLRQVWKAVNRQVGIWRWRDRDALRKHCTRQLGSYIILSFRNPKFRGLGAVGAEILVSMHQGGVDPDIMEELQDMLITRLDGLDERALGVLSWWFDTRGAAVTSVPREEKQEDYDAAEVALGEMAATKDIDRLMVWLAHPDARVVDAAVLKLRPYGDRGYQAIVETLTSVPPPMRARRLVEALEAWTGPTADAALGGLVSAEACTPHVRYLVGYLLLRRGQPMWPAMAAAVCADGPPWFRVEDWADLEAAGVDTLQIALDLASAHHSAAYARAAEVLLGAPDSPEVREGLRTFLRCGTHRLASLRMKVAKHLYALGDPIGFSLIVQSTLVKPVTHTSVPPGAGLFTAASKEDMEATVEAVIMGGPDQMDMRRLLAELDTHRGHPEVREAAWVTILHSTRDAAIHDRVLGRMKLPRSRNIKLRHLAETFAWGVQQGQRLLGRRFQIRMIGGEEYGHTRLTSSTINITPLPILRGERDGTTVVRGLILHEYGHHMYHAGDEGLEIWSEAQKVRLHNLLNLVADEHLERNLRAGDESAGNALKTLATYAFQRKHAEVPVMQLIHGARARSFSVLKNAKLRVARNADCVQLGVGDTLRELEASGSSFTRFFRALRMGLGDRHDDPKVAEALALFKGKDFRKLDMKGLWEITQLLHVLFGDEVKLLDCFDQHAVEGSEGAEGRIHGDGISDDEIQRAVDRILEPGEDEQTKLPDDYEPVLNRTGSEDFERITTVEVIPPDPGAHRARAERVGRPARKMREYFERLGLRLEPKRGRLRGHALDRGRLQSVLIRGDPRMLVAREPQYKSDLFLGVLVDCSGSMESGDNIEKARLFGTLLAEAAKGLRGVDAHFWGFTDRKIFDAGSAERCAVTSLVSSGGNNDAAALWHGAMAAQKSRRKARLLVMVSDGAPTECSVASLTKLASELTRRRKICCAQVAVRPLSDICFPHYVEVTDGDFDAAVRRFGKVVTGLVGKVMSEG